MADNGEEVQQTIGSDVEADGEDQRPEESEPEISYDLSSVPDKYSNFNEEKRGVAVVFVHTRYHDRLKCDDRRGAIKDMSDLRGVLKNLRFDVIIKVDESVSAILEALDEVAAMDHSNSDCLMVFALTHGSDTQLAAYDMWYETNSLWTAFSTDKCPSLVGKPKMFFIQACRGNSVDEGVTIQHPDADSGPMERQEPTPIMNTYKIPTTADMLIMYSTYDGNVSWKRNQGSWFIQAFCREFEQHAHGKELLYILRAVSRRVAYTNDTNVECITSQGLRFVKEKTKQMPTILSTLTKSYYFHKRKSPQMK